MYGGWRDQAHKPTYAYRRCTVSIYAGRRLRNEDAHVDGLFLGRACGFVLEFLQVGDGLDQPANDPDDGSEDVAGLAKARGLSASDFRGVQDDDWEGDRPDP